MQVKDEDLAWQPGLHSVATGAVLGFPPGTATPVVEGAPADDATLAAAQLVRRALQPARHVTRC